MNGRPIKHQLYAVWESRGQKRFLVSYSRHQKNKRRVYVEVAKSMKDKYLVTITPPAPVQLMGFTFDSLTIHYPRDWEKLTRFLDALLFTGKLVVVPRLDGETNTMLKKRLSALTGRHERESL